MTPRQLAQRIAGMDWSFLDLQHLLAVTAACEALNTMEPPAMTTDSNVIPFLPVRPAPNGLPVRPTISHRWVRLLHLDGREWCKAGFTGPGGAWDWIAETVAHEHECNQEAVGCVESEDDGDLVTVDGILCYRIAHGLC